VSVGDVGVRTAIYCSRPRELLLQAEANRSLFRSIFRGLEVDNSHQENYVNH